MSVEENLPDWSKRTTHHEVDKFLVSPFFLSYSLFLSPYFSERFIAWYSVSTSVMTRCYKCAHFFYIVKCFNNRLGHKPPLSE